MQRLGLLLAVCVVVLAGALCWALAARTGAAGAAASADVARPAPALPATDGPADIAPQVAPALALRVDVPRSESRPAEADGVEEHGATALPGGDWAWKYGLRPRAENERALTELEEQVRARSDAQFQARLRAENFVEHPLAADDARSLEQILADLRPAEPLFEARLVFDPVAAGAAGSQRPKAVRIVALPRAELPELYALADERDWLRRFLAPSGPLR